MLGWVGHTPQEELLLSPVHGDHVFVNGLVRHGLVAPVGGINVSGGGPDDLVCCVHSVQWDSVFC